MNEPWLCPRCGRMNAPFNPSCFCKPEEEEQEELRENSEPSEHVMDAARYLRPDIDPNQLYKILEAEKRKGEIINGMIPSFYDAKTKVNWPKYRCAICNGVHACGFDCASLSKNTLQPDGEFL